MLSTHLLAKADICHHVCTHAAFPHLLSVFLICICMTLFNLYQVVLITPFNWLVDGRLMKAEWRSASMECGGQCVMITGILVMPELCADSWDYLTQVIK